jgi:hypothetical protein
MIRDVYAGSGSQMFIPDPGVKKAQGSRIRIRNTAAMLESLLRIQINNYLIIMPHFCWVYQILIS